MKENTLRKAYALVRVHRTLGDEHSYITVAHLSVSPNMPHKEAERQAETLRECIAAQLAEYEDDE